MKKQLYITILAAGLLGLSTNMYASTPVAEKHEFKSSDREVNFEVERKSGEIALYIQSAFLNTYDQIIIERMGEANGGFAACKVLDISKMKLTGDYVMASDKFPLPAQTESSYRVKTIAKDGSTKTFPPVVLAVRDK